MDNRKFTVHHITTETSDELFACVFETVIITENLALNLASVSINQSINQYGATTQIKFWPLQDSSSNTLFCLPLVSNF